MAKYPFLDLVILTLLIIIFAACYRFTVPFKSLGQIFDRAFHKPLVSPFQTMATLTHGEEQLVPPVHFLRSCYGLQHVADHLCQSCLCHTLTQNCQEKQVKKELPGGLALVNDQPVFNEQLAVDLLACATACLDLAQQLFQLLRRRRIVVVVSTFVGRLVEEVFFGQLCTVGLHVRQQRRQILQMGHFSRLGTVKCFLSKEVDSVWCHREL